MKMTLLNIYLLSNVIETKYNVLEAKSNVIETNI